MGDFVWRTASVVTIGWKSLAWRVTTVIAHSCLQRSRREVGLISIPYQSFDATCALTSILLSSSEHGPKDAPDSLSRLGTIKIEIHRATIYRIQPAAPRSTESVPSNAASFESASIHEKCKRSFLHITQ